ncbi:MAG: BON domain-containing protein [Pseudomonadota bacterium]|nr:BON domain-containing protein [Pseudomonadota bacterium]
MSMMLIKKFGLIVSILSLALWSSPSFAGKDSANSKSDNSKVNQRDRSADALTADQQSNSEGDTELTRRIREDLMKIKDLSVYGQNVKIITVDGKVTVKGPVRSQDEENSILKSARSFAGASNVNNEMAIVKE